MWLICFRNCLEYRRGGLTPFRPLSGLQEIRVATREDSQVLCFPSRRLQSFPASGSFLMSRLFASGGQIIGAWTSTSFLRMNIQDWFPLELTSWISLQSKGPSKDVLHGKKPENEYLGKEWESFTRKNPKDSQNIYCPVLCCEVLAVHLSFSLRNTCSIQQPLIFY